LLARHPTLWEQMKRLDATLSELEQQGAAEAAYSAKLEELMQTVREARAHYEHEHTTPLPQ